jgi:hypothetical protein
MLAAAMLVGPAYAQATHIPTCDAFMERLRTAGRRCRRSNSSVLRTRRRASAQGRGAP